VLNRNPENYFAEVEQAAFNPAHLVPGIGPSPDKMLQGRLFSYGDKDFSRALTETPKEIPVTELIVLYRMPNDPERFEKYYREVHGPITSKLPGLKGYKYGPARALDGGPGEFFWYWSGTFDSRQAALDAMASPEGVAGAADVPNYYHDDPLFMFFEK
jgi:uncharacterized protein (TIGR02118 family)